MSTFDFETAWHEAAWPLYQTLPTTVLDLLSVVAVRTGGLAQLPDCSMPWPDADNNAPESLQSAFAAIPAETLSFAAAVIYAAGHWRPSSAPPEATIPGREYWRFAHYADQSLRARFGLPERGMNGREAGVGLAIHEGEIRVWYASRDTWQWVEVAPATAAGLEHAQKCQTAVYAALADIPLATSRRRDRDAAVWPVFERLTAERFTDPAVYPDAWRKIADTSAYMVDAQELERRRLARKPERDWQAEIARLKAKHAAKVQEMQIGLDGRVWLLERRQPVDNVIYYGHTGTFTWGWREPLSPESVSRVLDFISEFPYPYAIKQASGPTLEGGR